MERRGHKAFFHVSCGDFKNNYFRDLAVLNEIALCIKLTEFTNFSFQKIFMHSKQITMVHTLYQG